MLNVDKLEGKIERLENQIEKLEQLIAEIQESQNSILQRETL